MKVLLSISALKKTKPGKGKSEIYGWGMSADASAGEVPAEELPAHLKAMFDGNALVSDFGSGVRMTTTPTFEKIAGGDSLNLAGIGLPLYYGDPGGQLALFYAVIESDSKERKIGPLIEAILNEGKVRSGLALLAASANIALGILPVVLQNIPAVIQGNGDDLFTSGHFSALGPRYDVPEGQTVREYPFGKRGIVEGTLRVELIPEIPAPEAADVA